MRLRVLFVLRKINRQKVIPCDAVQKIGISPVYGRNTQNSGLMGRPVPLPYQQDVVRYLDSYLAAQKVKPKQIPKLTSQLIMPNQYNGPILPYDAVLLDEFRLKHHQQHLAKPKQ